MDDGSDDNTLSVLKSIENQVDRIIYKKANEGKGSAIRTGLEYCTGDVVVIQDADLEYEPEDLIKMLNHMDSNNLSVVYGSRVKPHSPHSSFVFYTGGKFLSWLVNFIYRTNITDEPTCYKMFKSSLIKNIKLTCKGFEFCPEVTAIVLRLGFKIDEILISYNPRSKKDGKKIRWRDGILAIWILIKYRFIPTSKLTKIS